MPPPLVLYSTNTYLKFRIQEDYLGTHHVWCSPLFEAEKAARYAIGAGQPPSSDPCSIYRNLARAVSKSDGHDDKIMSQKKTMVGLALIWKEKGLISEQMSVEIAKTVEMAQLIEWRPLIFVIPYAPLAERVSPVEREKRASTEPEYIIQDLRRSEFDILEPMS